LNILPPIDVKISAMKKVTHWLLILFLFSVPLSQWISIKLLIVLFVVSFFIKKSFKAKQFLFHFGDILAYLLILILGILYTQDHPSAWRVLETNFSFLAFPIVMLKTENIKESDLHNFLRSFLSGVLLATLICLINAVFLFINGGSVDLFFFEQFTSVINIQPIYLAYYIIFAITYGLYVLYYKKSSIHSAVIIFLLLYLFLILMLTGGKTSFISILLVFSFFILKFLVEESAPIKRITIGLICIMVVCMVLANSVEKDTHVSSLNDSWERFVLWESAIRASPDLLWGVGTGDYKDVLNRYYLAHNLPQYASESYNSHNQFIQILFTNGILGVIAILFLVGRPLYLSVKYNDVFGTLVFFSFLIYGMTEVFLGRYQGIVFFVILHQIFISYYSSLKPSFASLKGA